jgi:GNAT superfamily N-acetyltransferase
MQFTIRRCKDLNLIHKLKHTCFDKDSLSNDLSYTYWWVVWHGKEPAGFCGVQRFGGGGAFLSLAGVLPAYRGYGLQKRMVRVRERFCRGLGDDTMYSYTATFSAASMCSLISCGYRPYESETEWAGDEFVYWRRPLV